MIRFLLYLGKSLLSYQHCDCGGVDRVLLDYLQVYILQFHLKKSFLYEFDLGWPNSPLKHRDEMIPSLKVWNHGRRRDFFKLDDIDSKN